jgi:N-carbamoyl-L-amino-acid hydrolase
VPANMIFIRNDNGSHNPDEAMSMADFGDAARLLAAFVMSEAA